MIYVTGDCHSKFNKLSTASFPEQKQMSKKDIVIICGDFGGIWDTDKNSSYEEYWLKWLNEKSFTTVFVDGNHENFGRLYSEFDVVPFCGGKAHKIRNSIYHLARGEIYEFEGKRFFAFGGASSHDIKDGILSRDDFDNEIEFRNVIRRWKKQGKEFRIKGETWWSEEIPDNEEMSRATENLAAVDYNVEYVISHCAPQSIANKLYNSSLEADKLTLFFDELLQRLKFKYWFFGHYHEDKKVDDKFILLHDQIIRIV